MATQDPHIEVQFDPSQPTVIRPRRLRAFLLALLAVVFLLIGIGLAIAAEDVVARLMGAVCVGFGAWGAWKLFGVAFGKGGGLRLDADGLHAEGQPTLGWDEIAEFSYVEVNRQPMLGIHVTDEEALLERYSGALRPVARANRELTGTPYSLAVKNYAISIDELAALIAGHQQVFTGRADQTEEP